MRRAGIEVHTFSVRRPRHGDCLSVAHAEAAAGTCYLVDGLIGLLASLLRSLLRHPLRLARVLVASQRLSPPGLRARLLHLAYAVEAARLAREMSARNLHHVHVHMANNGAAVALLAIRFDPRMTYSLSIHGSAEFFHVDSWRLQAKVESALFVRCISHFCRAQVMAWTNPAAWSRFHIVHCGIDPQAFPPRAPLRGGPLRILTVGRLDPIKGYPLLLEACQALSNRNCDWTLDMVGDGPLKSFLEQRIRELRLSDRVTLSGAVGQDRIQEHFDRADVMVVSSFMEGVPVVLMEAMAKQFAVVATRVGGIPELVDDGINGLLVTPGSVQSLADALERLARDPVELWSLGHAAREKIVKEFSTDDLGSQMADLFRRYCLGELPRTPAPDAASTPATLAIR